MGLINEPLFVDVSEAHPERVINTDLKSCFIYTSGYPAEHPDEHPVAHRIKTLMDFVNEGADVNIERRNALIQKEAA